MGDENGLHRVYVMVGYNKLNLYLVDNNLVRFYESLLVNIIGLRGFWLKTISYGDIPKVVVICELYAKGNSFTSADHSV